jgi:segregation and condensation protein B
VSNDERPESLAAQAAAWVPPWERPRAEPDRAYEAAHRATDDAGDAGDEHAVVSAAEAEVEESLRAEQVAVVEERAGELGADAEREVARDRAADLGAGGERGLELDGRAEGGRRPDDDEDRSGAGLSDDDDDFDGAFEGGNPPGYGEPEPGDETGAVVDAPQELSGEDEPEPTDVRLGDEVPVPGPIEEAAGAGEDEGGAPVDAPLSPDGDDAGDVFDEAADDDVTDDGDVDLPFVEVVPDGDDDEAPFDGDDAGSADGGNGSGLDGDDAESGDAEDESGLDADDDESGDADEESGLDGDDAESGDGEEKARLEADDTGPGDGGEEAALKAESAESDSSGPDSAAAYAAGAADFAAALRDVAGRQAGDGDDVSEALPSSRPAAADGMGVPQQGRRRRGRVDASGGDEGRTSSGDDVGSEAAAEAVTSSMPALEDDAELASALEAIMLVVDEPVVEMQLAQILEQPTERVATVLEDLSARYTAAGHGFDLRRAAGGWRLYTRPEYAAYVERFVLDGQSVRLTQAALETLAVVAYKQPVTRSRISAIRGVNCDGVMRTLATRGLIEECGTEGETGAHLYRTTALFLEKLGLNSVDQLPPLAPFLPDDVEEVLDATG